MNLSELTPQPSQERFYHNGTTKANPTTRRPKLPAHAERQVIAWDMEGLSLSGNEKPQHAVLFGCSAEVDTPMVSQKLALMPMLEYIMAVNERYPHSIHVGYAFKYDANMILAGLPIPKLDSLWRKGKCSFDLDGWRWLITLIPGKKMTVSKRIIGSKRNSRGRRSITIYDYSTFFGVSKFIDTCEKILGDELTEEDRQVVQHGKDARGHQSWEDMPEIQHYWSREIILIKRTFEKFRSVMVQAGFALKEWYGPGALANYINSVYEIKPHLAAVQVTSGDMPHEVHEASKRAFAGGRFELFEAGRIRGPLWSADINSAYPYALTQLPSFEHGRWEHVCQPKRIAWFGFYRVKYTAPNARPIEHRKMPLFYRDGRGMVSYPNRVHGWYAAPEAALMLNMPGAEIIEGWEWESATNEKPWNFLHEMFERRMKIGKHNLMSMPFKLGPNSLYGKYAQTVGWNEDTCTPPKSHALPIAAWVTSYCRAMLYRVIVQAPNDIVAVETDSVLMRCDPRTLNLKIGKELGQWDVDEYDEALYMQSGMYHLKKDGQWLKVRSRGMHAAEYPYESADRYVRTLECGEEWREMELPTKPRFIGMGAALASPAPFRELHTSWRAAPRKVKLGDTGKRVHVPKLCPQCRRGISPNDAAHTLVIRSRSDGETMSRERRLPWENKQYPEVSELVEALDVEDDCIAR